MAAVGFARNLLRPSTGDESSRVSFVELFFDLVFVFAVTQVSQVLVERAHEATLAHVAVLLTAVWWVWINTTWAMNFLNPEVGLVRGLLIGMMFFGLLLSSAIPDAFGGRAWVFAGALIVMEVGRSLFTALAFGRFRPAHGINFARIAVWQACAGVLWLTGALTPPDARLWFWIGALAIYSSGPPLRFWVPKLGRSGIEVWDISGEHMAERVGLFFIIALGESVLVTGRSFSEGAIDASHTLALLAAFAGTVLMWLLYFNHSARGGTEYIRSSPQAGRVGRVAYTYVPLVMVLGIVLGAVADEFVLHRPGAPAGAWTATLTTGSFAIYLLGNLLFRRAVGGNWLVTHILGALALAGLFWMHASLSALVLSWLVNAVALAVVIADDVAWRRRRPPAWANAEAPT